MRLWTEVKPSISIPSGWPSPTPSSPRPEEEAEGDLPLKGSEPLFWGCVMSRQGAGPDASRGGGAAACNYPGSCSAPVWDRAPRRGEAATASPPPLTWRSCPSLASGLSHDFWPRCFMGGHRASAISAQA